LIEGDKYYLDGSTDPLSLPMFHYSVLWHAVGMNSLKIK